MENLDPCSPHTCDMFWSHQLPGVLSHGEKKVVASLINLSLQAKNRTGAAELHKLPSNSSGLCRDEGCRGASSRSTQPSFVRLPTQVLQTAPEKHRMLDKSTFLKFSILYTGVDDGMPRSFSCSPAGRRRRPDPKLFRVPGEQGDDLGDQLDIDLQTLVDTLLVGNDQGEWTTGGGEASASAAASTAPPPQGASTAAAATARRMATNQLE
eukprot:scaffold10933_cov51-Phaeocystis_antarctica.AAC.2